MRRWGSVVAFLSVGCLSYQEFLDKKNDKYCDMAALCNPEGDCSLPDETAAGDTGCDFDVSEARECLHETWLCNTDFPGNEYPLPPTACERVCR